MRDESEGKRDSAERGLLKIVLMLLTVAVTVVVLGVQSDARWSDGQKTTESERQTDVNAQRMLEDGKHTFRFDTFGDEAFWSDALQLHRALAGAQLGGVGPGVSPKTALAVGLKVDADALPGSLVSQLKQGRVNLDDPATTLALIKLDSVLGVREPSIPTAALNQWVSRAPFVTRLLTTRWRQALDVVSTVGLTRT